MPLTRSRLVVLGETSPAVDYGSQSTASATSRRGEKLQPRHSFVCLTRRKHPRWFSWKAEGSLWGVTWWNTAWLRERRRRSQCMLRSCDCSKSHLFALFLRVVILPATRGQCSIMWYYLKVATSVLHWKLIIAQPDAELWGVKQLKTVLGFYDCIICIHCC